MKILSTIFAHDKRSNTLQEVIENSKKIDSIGDLEVFCFDTEPKTIKLAKDNNLVCNVYKRPEPDKNKLSCSYVLITTGMREAELMQLSWLRNKALEKCVRGNYSHIFYIDADVIIPKEGLNRLLKLKSDIAMGWYFHKRLASTGVSWKGNGIPLSEAKKAINMILKLKN